VAAGWKVLELPFSQHVLTASTVTYRMTKLGTVPYIPYTARARAYEYEPGLILYVILIA
jgi:hypothetical protein